jgi:hypothetical protein
MHARHQQAGTLKKERRMILVVRNYYGKDIRYPFRCQREYRPSDAVFRLKSSILYGYAGL